MLGLKPVPTNSTTLDLMKASSLSRTSLMLKLLLLVNSSSCVMKFLVVSVPLSVSVVTVEVGAKKELNAVHQLIPLPGPTTVLVVSTCPVQLVSVVLNSVFGISLVTGVKLSNTASDTVVVPPPNAVLSIKKFSTIFQDGSLQKS